MRLIMSFLVILSIALSTISFTAEAARFGGGKSFGMSRSISSNRTYQNSNAMPRGATQGNRWLAPLAGLAMGGLLASLFMGHGVGAGIMSWLLIGGVIFFIWRLFMTSQTSRLQTEPRQRAGFQTIEGQFSRSAANQTYSDFDQNQFLRQAKSAFIRLQAAYDNKNLMDIRTFTAPEIFAEIQLQLNERGNTANYTDVLQLNAELIDLDIQSDHIIASVLFTGQIKESEQSAPISIREIWHFQQTKPNPQWIVAGLQQSE